MIVDINEHYQLRMSEWLLSLILTSWGAVCFFISDYAWHQPALAGLARYGAPHEVWGAVAFTIGATRIVALYINGARQRTPHARALGAFFSIFIWLQLSFGMLTADVITMGLAVYPWFVLADLYNLIRAGRDARFSDLKAHSTREAREDAKLAHR